MKSEQRKLEIKKTAEMLFKEKGYSAVTMRDIARKMGIKAASLYNHIQSKQQILSEIIISIAEQFTNGMNAIMNADVSNVEKLEKIIALHIQITTENPSRMATMNNDWMHLEEEMEYYLRLRKNYEESFRTILLDGMKKNEIISVNPEVILFSILSTLRSLYLWIPKKEDIAYVELTKDLSQILLNGVVVNE